jgi:hypothetical protein
MKRVKYIPLYCSRATQTQLDYEAEDDLFYFPPIREGNSTPLTPSESIPAPSRYISHCSQPAQQTTSDSQAELLDFPSIIEGNDTRLAPCRPQATQRGSQSPLSSEEASQLQRRRQPNIGLGRANIADTVDAAVPVKV